jgi:hypothetical protein
MNAARGRNPVGGIFLFVDPVDVFEKMVEIVTILFYNTLRQT